MTTQGCLDLRSASAVGWQRAPRGLDVGQGRMESGTCEEEAVEV